VGRDEPELEASIIRARVVEHSDAAEELADIAHENAARLTGEPFGAIDADTYLRRRRAEVLRARHHIGEPTDAILQAAVNVSHHERVEARAVADAHPLRLI